MGFKNPSAAAPDQIGALAAHAKDAQPDLFNRALAIYAQHPTLVKMLGTVAVARIAQQLNKL